MTDPTQRGVLNDWDIVTPNDDGEGGLQTNKRRGGAKAPQFRP